ncbi:SGNH/GDSL hydrolase family protein [Pyxidicoccus sp. 3LFB2]
MKKHNNLFTVIAWLFASACAESGAPEPSPRVQVARALSNFDPLPNGFDYTARPRFRPSSEGDDISYVRPESFLLGLLLDRDFYKLDVNGCPPGVDPNTQGYGFSWTLDGSSIGNGDCMLELRFNNRGTHLVGLTVSKGEFSRTYTQTVEVKDILVVALGDSYASGEGAPDVPGHESNGDWIRPEWNYRPCHRSSKAPSAVFARQLEDADPKSTVTYLSLACSGATISRETYDGSKPFVEYYLNEVDPNKARGKGLLSGYVGPEGTRYEKAQVAQLKEIVASRPVDALIIGAGGNDMGFSDMLSYCVKGDKLWTTYSANGHWLGVSGPPNPCNFNPDPNSYPHRERIHKRGQLPGRFDDLRQALAGVNAVNVFLTEYPDPGYSGIGTTCNKVLWDAPLGLGVIGGDVGLLIEKQEIEWLRTEFLEPLNQIVRDAAERHQWHYVLGISYDFAQGHGYCTGDDKRWFVKFDQSIRQQGPQDDKLNTKGVMHPNEAGYAAIASRMYEAYATTRPDLILDGTMLRATGTPEVYVIRGRAKFRIPNPDWFADNGVDPAFVRVVPHDVLSRISDIPQSGTILRESGNPAIYVIAGGARFWVPDAASWSNYRNALGLTDAAIRQVPPGGLQHIPATPADGTVVREVGKSGVWVYQGGGRFWVPSPSAWTDYKAATGITDASIRPIPTGSLSYTVAVNGHEEVRAREDVPRDSTVVREVGKSGIWVYQGGGRFWVPSPSAWTDYKAATGTADASIRPIPTGSLSYTVVAVNGQEEVRAREDAPRDGTVVKELGAPQVYIYQGGGNFLFSSQAELDAWGVPAQQIRLLPQGSLQRTLSLANGAEAETSRDDMPRDGTLIRERTDTQVYQVQNRKKYPVSSHDVTQVKQVPNGSSGRVPNG